MKFILYICLEINIISFGSTFAENYGKASCFLSLKVLFYSKKHDLKLAQVNLWEPRVLIGYY